MKVLLVNKFLYLKGGDAASALNTGTLLTGKGHKVIFWGMGSPKNSEYPYKEYFVDHVDFSKRQGFFGELTIALNVLYSLEAKHKIERLISIDLPDVVHLHNFAHQISPSILHIFRKYNIPVIMTMHDYKLVCPVYTLLTKGKLCERCKHGRYYNCLLRRCAKDSYVNSLVNTMEMYLHHKFFRIYNLIDTFIAPSRFLLAKVAEMGLNNRIINLPYFVNYFDFRVCYDWQEKSIIYFGRLSSEKGLFTLLEAMKRLPDITLKIVGEGPSEEELLRRSQASGLSNIRFLGYLSGEALKDEIRKSMFVVLPSEWYENYPFTIIEGFALGKPAVGARIGGIPELVEDNETGLTFEAGNVEDLRAKIDYMASCPDEVRKMGMNAREFVEKELNAEKHYEKLMEIYRLAIERHKK